MAGFGDDTNGRGLRHELIVSLDNLHSVPSEIWEALCTDTDDFEDRARLASDELGGDISRRQRFDIEDALSMQIWMQEQAVEVAPDDGFGDEYDYNADLPLVLDTYTPTPSDLAPAFAAADARNRFRQLEAYGSELVNGYASKSGPKGNAPRSPFVGDKGSNKVARALLALVSIRTVGNDLHDLLLAFAMVTVPVEDDRPIIEDIEAFGPSSWKQFVHGGLPSSVSLLHTLLNVLGNKGGRLYSDYKDATVAFAEQNAFVTAILTTAVKVYNDLKDEVITDEAILATLDQQLSRMVRDGELDKETLDNFRVKRAEASGLNPVNLRRSAQGDVARKLRTPRPDLVDAMFAELLALPPGPAPAKATPTRGSRE